MARTKQTARKSTGGRAPRKVLNGTVNGDHAVSVDPEETSETEALHKAIAEGDMLAELKHLDKKYTEEGTAFYVETVHEDIPDQIDWWGNFALCLVRHFDEYDKKRIARVCLEINSQHLKDMLKDLIPSFPGVSFQTQDVLLDAPYRVLFHYRKEIEAAGEQFDEGSEAAQHHALLLDFINENFGETIKETDNLLEHALINFEHLWTIFRPGCTILGQVFGQPRAFEVENYSYSCRPSGLNLHCRYIDFDGDSFGYRTCNRFVPAFQGSRAICDLAAFPLDWHKDQAVVQRLLIERGHRFEQQAGINFHRYSGIALDTCFDEEDGKIVRYNINSRVVVDTKTFHRMNADFSYYVTPFEDELDPVNPYDRTETAELLPDSTPKFLPLTEEQLLLASSTVRGFSFTEKRWLDFFIDKLTPPAWNPNAFDKLVLPHTQKDLVRSLVATHSQQRGGFDDIVKGKGMGLIMVLHGPPGVGKTLTAETVAEFTQRPLYMVSSGDLGTESSTLDQRLTRILDMASTWNAVLLIDEADIFLEARSLHDLERNSLVSIFLRVLEYYEGILFLTSNRVATFDSAFKSRIHVPLKYGELTFESRKAIWRNFLAGGNVEIGEVDVDVLAKAELNGRQIKNVVRTAGSLAQYKGQELDVEKLLQVIQIQMDFEDELDSLMEVDKRGLGGKMVVVNGH